MEFFDTHCHIQSIGASDSLGKKWSDGAIESIEKVLKDAREAHVNKVIAVGTDLDDSERAVDVAEKHTNCWASVGIHPHEAKRYQTDQSNLRKIRKLCDEEKVVAIGEVGLDYFYEHSDRDVQISLLEQLLSVAQEKNLPVILHVREAHGDFWPIFDNFPGLSGVLHSFSAHLPELEAPLKRNLHVALNGIMTFSSDSEHKKVVKAVPKEKFLLETDAPFLTPAPFRGKICKPEHVAMTAKFLAELRGETVEYLADYTSQNAHNLFLDK